MQKFSDKAIADSRTVLDLGYVGMFQDGITDYLNASYWGESPNLAFPPFAILWDIRTQMGLSLADKVAAAMLQTIGESSVEVRDEDMNLYLIRVLMIGDSIVDNECGKWHQIQKIAIAHGMGNAVIEAREITPSGVSNACIKAWKQ